MTEKPLLIRTYGEFNITYDGKDITDILSRKSIGMIIYMLCSSGMKVSKNSLKELLWVDTSEEKASYNLRFNLWNIKKNIPDIDGEPFIISERGVCMINRRYPFEILGLNELVGFDFDSRAYAANHAVIKGILEKANGTGFMEHFYIKDCDEFNDWLMLERTDRDHKLIQAMSGIVDYMESARDYESALNIIERLIVFSPYDDDLRMHKMELCLKTGNDYGAIKEYKVYCNVLRNELGMKPSKQIKTLYNEAVSRASSKEPGHFRLKKYGPADYFSFIDFMSKLADEYSDRIVLEISDWDGIDEKSKELFMLLSKNRLVEIRYSPE